MSEEQRQSGAEDEEVPADSHDDDATDEDKENAGDHSDTDEQQAASGSDEDGDSDDWQDVEVEPEAVQELLKDAPHVRATLRNSTTLSFGSSFALYFSGTLPTSQAHVAERLREAVEQQLANAVDDCAISIDVGPAPGEQAPVTAVTSVSDGKPIDNMLASEAEVQVIMFWVTWAPPCLQMLQQGELLLAEHAKQWGQRVRLVACNLEESKSAPQEFLSQFDPPRMSHVWMSPPVNDQTWQVTALPSLAVVKRGKIVWRGHSDDVDLLRSIQALLAGSENVVEASAASPTQPPTAAAASSAAADGSTEDQFLPKLDSLSESAVLQLLDDLVNRVKDVNGYGLEDVKIVVEDAKHITASSIRSSRRLLVFGEATPARREDLQNLERWLSRRIAADSIDFSATIAGGSR